jgi:hypothetical protein
MFTIKDHCIALQNGNSSAEIDWVGCMTKQFQDILYILYVPVYGRISLVHPMFNTFKTSRTYPVALFPS